MEPDVLKSLAILAAIFIVPVAFALFSIKRPPIWKDKGPLAPLWSKINVFSAVAAIFTSSITFAIYHDYMLEYRSIATLSTALLTFTLGQTLATDFSQRLADRRILNSASVISALAGFWFLYNFDYASVGTYIILAIGASCLFFLKSLGDSDVRAIQLIILSALPIVSLAGLQTGMVLFLLFLIVYAVGYSIRHRNFKLAIFTKMSLPLVPLAIAPYLVVVITHPLFNIS